MSEFITIHLYVKKSCMSFIYIGTRIYLSDSWVKCVLPLSMLGGWGLDLKTKKESATPGSNLL